MGRWKSGPQPWKRPEKGKSAQVLARKHYFVPRPVSTPVEVSNWGCGRAPDSGRSGWIRRLRNSSRPFRNIWMRWHLETVGPAARGRPAPALRLRYIANSVVPNSSRRSEPEVQETGAIAQGACMGLCLTGHLLATAGCIREVAVPAKCRAHAHGQSLHSPPRDNSSFFRRAPLRLPSTPGILRARNKIQSRGKNRGLAPACAGRLERG